MIVTNCSLNSLFCFQNQLFVILILVLPIYTDVCSTVYSSLFEVLFESLLTRENFNLLLLPWLSQEKIVSQNSSFIQIHRPSFECLWVQWCEYVHELKDGMFYSTRRSRVEWNIPAFNEWTYSHHCTNEKHSLFVLYNIQVDLCHFDWKI